MGLEMCTWILKCKEEVEAEESAAAATRMAVTTK